MSKKILNISLLTLFLIIFSFNAFGGVTDNLAQYYNFVLPTGNAIDSLNIYNLTQYGTVPNQTGLINGARGAFATTSIRFNGTSATLSTGTDFTYYFVLYKSGSWASKNEIIDTKMGSSTFRFEVYGDTTNQLKIKTGKADVADYTIHSINMPDNIWITFFFTFNSTNKETKLYVNGVLNSSSGAQTMTSVTNSAYIVIGDNYVPSTPSTGTYIDELGRWNRIITSSEMSQINGSSYPFVSVSNFTLISFLSQSPADVTDLSLFSGPVNISYFYNMSNFSNNAYLNFSIADSQSCLQFINGSCVKANNTYFRSNNVSFSNLSVNFSLTENDIYPFTINYNVSLFTNTQRSIFNLTSNNELLSESLFNISNSTQFNILEVMLNTSDNTQVFACNSSYGFSSNLLVNSNCQQIGFISTSGFNHLHGNFSKHNLVPFTISNGRIGGSGIKITPSMYFVYRGSTGFLTNVGFLNYNSTIGSVAYSSNNGNAWTTQSITLDSHLHQFSNATYFKYQACGNFSGSINCSDFRTDVFDIAALPPTPAIITNPSVNNSYFTQFINITYLNATANTYAANISYYLIDLYNVNHTFILRLKNNSLNNSYFWDPYLLNVSSGSYFIGVTAVDTSAQNATGFSEDFVLNYTSPNINISYASFSNFDGLNASPVTTINVTCLNYLNPNATLLIRFNGQVMFNGSHNNQSQINTSTLVDGYNNLSVVCSDFLGSVSFDLSKLVYVKSLCLIDELDNTPFNNNISSVRVYFDDNSSYFDYKVAGVSCINYTSLNLNKLRFDLKYSTGVTINRYVDTGLLSSPIRVCANKEGVTHYEQIIVAASSKPVIMKSVFSNCIVGADYTRFAYQDALLLKVYTINTLYYFYTMSTGVQTYLASIDGSISTFINLDTLEFRQQAYNINIKSDTISFEQIENNVTQIYYKNIKNDNVNASIKIVKMNNGVTYFDSSAFANPNEITILFDYSTLGVNSSTVFKISGTFCKTDGTCSEIVQYFNTMGKSGYLNSALAFVASLLLMIFGLSLATSKTTFGWFGAIINILAIGILSFALMTWYILFLLVIEIIILIYIILVMIFSKPSDVLGVN